MPNLRQCVVVAFSMYRHPTLFFKPSHHPVFDHLQHVVSKMMNSGKPENEAMDPQFTSKVIDFFLKKCV